MPRVALPDSLQLCKIFGCLHSIRSKIDIFCTALSLTISTTTEVLFIRCAFHDPIGYPEILGNTLFNQDYDSVFFSFLIIKPTMLPTSMLGHYSTRASSTPSSFFFVVPTYWETCFSSSPYSTYFFFSLFLGSSCRPSCPP
jgi:hypothetical protein